MRGRRVKIRAKGRIFEGIALPSEEGKIVLKLDSGYNVGFYDYELLEEEEFEVPEVELPAVKERGDRKQARRYFSDFFSIRP